MRQSAQFGWQRDQYALLDFGEGRKLERFGPLVLDRPCPAALVCGRSQYGRTAKSAGRGPDDGDEELADWEGADARLDMDGRLLAGSIPAEGWQCGYDSLQFRLKLTPFGHVGLFPEQAANWQWLTRHCAQRQRFEHLPLNALNLFAYTGGTTMCLAKAGARVVHVDASSPAVKWARANAASSGCTELPIRWIVDDARKFVTRELRRGNRYDIVVLDPPSFGHGIGGQRFTIEEHLPELLQGCVDLIAPTDGAILLSAHCEYPTLQTIADWIRPSLGTGTLEHDRLHLTTESGKKLDAGFYVRAIFSSDPSRVPLRHM